MEKLQDYVRYSGENKDEQILKKLKDCLLPVVVYGFGNSGQVLIEMLNYHGISVQAAFVDDAYYRELQDDEIKLYRKSEIDKIFDAYIVVVGMTNYTYAKQSLRTMTNCKQIFCFANPYRYLDERILTWEYYWQHKELFQQSFECFEDETSREIFKAYINTAINRDASFLLGYEGGKTYFNQDLFEIGENETYVDAGAYNGDSVENFLNAVQGRYKEIYAIEPDIKNFDALIQKSEQRNWKRIKMINCGLWEKKSVLKFSADNQQESSILTDKTVNSEEILVDTLDSVLKGRKISFLKLSVQGAEYEALQGAAKTIENHRPKIAMTIFMKMDALLRIPMLLKEKYPFYRLYLRCEEPFWARVILYAVPYKN